MNKLLASVCFLMLLLSGCGTSQTTKHSFGIYLIKDGEFTEVGTDHYYLKPIQIDFHTVELLNKPVISDKDIIEYDWNRHTVTISSDAAAHIPHPDSFGIPFVVVADGHRCYLAGFWTRASSIATPLPIIDERAARNGKFTIEKGYPRPFQEREDPRNDERVRRSLKSLGKLKQDR